PSRFVSERTEMRLVARVASIGVSCRSPVRCAPTLAGATVQVAARVSSAAERVELHSGVPWRSEWREMYDREVDVPRLLGHFRLDPAPTATPAAIREAARRVVAHLGVPFNSVGLNLYRDGRDSVAPHNDHLYDIRDGFPIALL